VIFLSLGSMLTRLEIEQYALIGIAMSLLVIFVARPLAVFGSLSFFPKKRSRSAVDRRTMGFYSLVGPRGVVSVVMSTVPYTIGVTTGNPLLLHYGTIIAVVVSFVVLFSIIIQTVYIPIVAKKLLKPPQNGS